jgi:hypothetical protein
VNEAAFRVMREATEKHDPERPKNPAAVALGRLGASKGGSGPYASTVERSFARGVPMCAGACAELMSGDAVQGARNVEEC